MSNSLRAWMAAAALMLTALIPVATAPSDTNVAAPTIQPTATLAPAPAPLKANKPTRTEVGNQIAQNTWDRNTAHYQCRNYPSRDKLQPQDMIPTANVSATIAYDPRTHSYQVITVDPRIIIGHETIRRTSRYTDTTFTIDRYNWSYAKNVKPYGVFIRSIDQDGNVYWGRLNPEHRADGANVMGADRAGDQVWIAIVATDTTTCKAGNTLPASMWRSISPNLLY